MSKSAITQELFHDIIEQCAHATALGLHKIYYCEYLGIVSKVLDDMWTIPPREAYIQVKVAEMNIITSSGSKGHPKSLQTTLSFAPGLACLGLNDPMEQY